MYVRATLHNYFFCLSYYRDRRDLHSFPTRRSSDLLSVDPRQANSGRLVRPTKIAPAARRLPTLGVSSVGTNSASRRSEEHTSELQSHHDLVCRLLLEKKKTKYNERLALGNVHTYVI